ncbi:MAG: hypothetical protein IJV74_05975, partial [Clostridia bacterium]|nr:hypothetical protein [Clostridia bacterium]
MAGLPILKNEYVNREVTDSFSGYRHRMKIAEGELYDCRNLSTAHYPLLANRAKRGRVRIMGAPGGLLAKEKLAWVDEETLWYGGEATGVTGLSAGEKQLVSMGAYICIVPDKIYFNTADAGDWGSMEARYTSTGAVNYSLCQIDGGEYKKPSLSENEPDNPENAALWIDTSAQPHLLRQWSAALGEWVEVSSVYTKLSFASYGEIPKLFKVDDGISISGSAVDDVNGEKLICALGGDEENTDYIVIAGLLDEALSQEEGFVSLERTVPEMDFVVECRNRLWGCKYGPVEGENLNEIYCCALGDVKNWRQYRGLASDSWTASVGSDGAWTGAVNFLGYPTFFKENRIHKVSISAYGAHQITETVCRGVQKGCEKSLAVVNETLFYKARGDVCAFQGGFPTAVSEALGDEKYTEAAAGSIGDSYYISMKDAEGKWTLFVYDVLKKIWIKEDGLECSHFASLGDELYAI